LVSQLGGYLALTYALVICPRRHIGEPVVASPLTAVWRLVAGEPLSAYQIAGGALVLIGVGLANRLGKPEQEANTVFGETGVTETSP